MGYIINTKKYIVYYITSLLYQFILIYLYYFVKIY